MHPKPAFESEQDFHEYHAAVAKDEANQSYRLSEAEAEAEQQYWAEVDAALLTAREKGDFDGYADIIIKSEVMPKICDDESRRKVEQWLNSGKEPDPTTEKPKSEKVTVDSEDDDGLPF